MKWWLLGAVGWATGIMGAFFVLRFMLPPFSEWSHGDQAQLLQAMIGLAGFGAGFVALWSALVQLRRLTARPDLKISIARSVGARTAEDAGLVTLFLEVENKGGGVCRDWQVALTTTGDSTPTLGQQGWQQLADGTLVYNASGKPLFPRNPFPLPAVSVLVHPDLSLGDDAFTWVGLVDYDIATEHAQKGSVLTCEQVVPAIKYPTISVQDEPGGRWHDLIPPTPKVQRPTPPEEEV